VSDNEADLKQGKSRQYHRLQKGLIGKKVGDVVEIKVPIGIIPFEIIEISV